jgi:hypothetical protein
MSNTFAVKEVLDFTVEKYVSSGRGDILFTVDYATQTNISTSAERLDIRGGSGNFKIVSIDHTKDCTFAATLPIVDIKTLAVKLGKDITKGATTTPMKEILAADASNTITLSQTPITSTLKVYQLVGERDLGTEQIAGDPALNQDEYSISGTTITLNETTAPEGTKFIVFYDYTSGINAENIKITAEDFPQFIKLTGRGLMNDDVDGTLVPVSFTIHKAKVQPNFELTMSSDSATELDFTCDCYTILNANGEREFVDIVKLNDEAK